MTISDDVLRIWMRKARKNLRRYWDHPDLEDIISEAYLTMWDALRKLSEGTIQDVESYAMRAAWNGAQAYLSSPANIHRTFNVFHRKAVEPPIYLEDVRRRHEQPEWTPRRLVEPDFVPPLIERLAAIEALAQLPPRRRAALILCCLQGLTRDEACAQLGLSRDQIYHALRGVSHAAIPCAHPGGRLRAKAVCPHCGRAKDGDNVTLDGRCRHCRLVKARGLYHAARSRAFGHGAPRDRGDEAPGRAD